MKKKILCVAIIIAMLIAILCILTGCGKNEVIEEDTNVSQEDSNSNTETESKQELDIEEIKYAYDSGIAMLTSNETTTDNKIVKYIVDSNGKLLYKDTSTTGERFINGYLIKNYEADYNNYNSSYVLDKNGNKILFSNANVDYRDISKNGYVLLNRKEDSLSGITYKTNIEDMNGNIIYTLEGEVEGYWVLNDVFCIETSNEKRLFVDASTKNTLEIETNLGLNFDAKGFNNWIYIKNNIISSDLQTRYENCPEMKNELNDKYYLSVYNGIVDFTGKTIYDFSEGGYKYVYYYEDTYYVISDTGYLYTMDDNFNTIAQPVKISETDMVLTTKRSSCIFG